MPPMVDLFPKDRLRQFLMAVFIALAIIEFARASLLLGSRRYYFCSKLFTKGEDVGSKSMVSILQEVRIEVIL